VSSVSGHPGEEWKWTKKLGEKSDWRIPDSLEQGEGPFICQTELYEPIRGAVINYMSSVTFAYATMGTVLLHMSKPLT